MKRKQIGVILLALSIACQPMTAFAKAAPDGKTDASQTAAAAGGAWETWCEKWETIKEDWTIVSLSPGADETQMNFAWYGKAGETATFKYGTKSDLSDGKDAQIVTSDAQEGYVSNKVTLTGLQAGVTYYYEADGKGIESFTTDDDASSFSFIFVGDPQIGSSNSEKAKKPEDILKPTFLTAQSESVRSDTFNWNYTLERAYAKTGNKASFVLSAGDQIQTTATKVKNTTISEIEYTGYLSPTLLKSLPVATTVGNHDADNPNYLAHFNIANLSEKGTNGYVGGDYYYTYGDALFMMLNTQKTNVADHKEFIEQTVAANPNCKWKVVTLHQDIYGSAEHSNEPEIVKLRYDLVPVFEANGIDLVLTGHDHAYSRTKLLKGGTDKTDGYEDDEFDAQLEKDLDDGDSPVSVFTAPAHISDDTQDPDEQKYLEYLKKVMDEEAILELTDGKDMAVNSEGVLYLTAGSSSGSKYYDLVPRMQTYIAARWQEDVPTYSVIDVTETTLTINTYRTDTDEAVDSQFMLVKTADISQLSQWIAEAEKLNKSDYVAGVDTFEQALAAAVKVAEDPTSTESTITNALTALQTAMQGLVKKADSSQTTAEAEKLNKQENQDAMEKPVKKTGGTESAAGVNKKPEISSVKTGDEASGVIPSMLMAGLSAAAVAFLMMRREQR